MGGNRASSSSCRFLRVLACAWAVVPICGAEAQALITGDLGNKPVQDRGWPAGSLAVANLASRLGWWEGPPFGGGMYVFLFRAKSTDEFNEALAAFASIKAPQLEVALHDGPEESDWLKDHNKPRGEPQAQARIDWTFTIWQPENWHRLHSDPRGASAADQDEFRKPVDPPRIDVYLGGGNLKWEQAKLPKNVLLIDERSTAVPVELDDKSLIHGHVRDMASGKPIGAAVLTALKPYSGPQGYEWKKVAICKSDDQGAFELKQVDPEAAELRVRVNGYATRTIILSRAGYARAYSLDVQLSREAKSDSR